MMRLHCYFFLLCTCGALFWGVSTTPAAECEQAKLEYQQGIRLIKFEERRDAFRRAVDLCPTYAEAHVNLADALENLGEFVAAERHYQEALAHKPDFSAPFIGLGEIYLKTGRFGLAKEAFSRGLGVAPGDARLSDGLKAVNERLRREKEAFTAEDMKNCLERDERFSLMCMCPTERYEYLRRWICLPPVMFREGSWGLDAGERRQLDEIAKVLRAEGLSERRWVIIGHADNTGRRHSNLALSKRRAEAVRRRLTSRHGVAPDKIRMIFFGQVFPRATNTSIEGRTENRRVEIVPDPTDNE